MKSSPAVTPTSYDLEGASSVAAGVASVRRLAWKNADSSSSSTPLLPASTFTSAPSTSSTAIHQRQRATHVNRLLAACAFLVAFFFGLLIGIALVARQVYLPHLGGSSLSRAVIHFFQVAAPTIANPTAPTTASTTFISSLVPAFSRTSTAASCPSTDPLTFKPATFTPSPLYASRWPLTATNDNNNHNGNDGDPFAAPSGHRMSGVRGAFVSIYTEGERKHLVGYFQKNNENLFNVTHDHADWLIFVIVYPHNSWDSFTKAMTQLKLQPIDLGNDTALANSRIDLTPQRRELMHAHGARMYRAPTGFPVFAIPLAINLPSFFERNSSAFLAPTWSRCYTKDWSMEYMLYSGSAFPTQVLAHPVLDGYDFWLKIDLDIVFEKRPPTSPFLLMAKSQCLWTHTRIMRESPRTDSCQRLAINVTEHYMQRECTRPQSWNATWYKDENIIFYGNFVGGWLGFLRSSEAQRFLHYLYYEDEKFMGYFMARWGDQATYVKLIGMFLELGDAQMGGGGALEGSGMCSLESWRKDYFVHRKL